MFKKMRRNASIALRGSWGVAVAMLVLMIGLQFLLSLTEHLLLTLADVEVYFQFLPSPQMPTDSVMMEHPEALVITAIIALVSVLLVFPLSVGITGWYYQLSGNQRGEFGSIFHYFEGLKLFLKSLWLNLSILIRCFFWGMLIFCVPLVMMGTCGFYAYVNRQMSPAQMMLLSFGVVVGLVLLLLAAVVFWITLNRYYLAAYLFTQQPELKVRRAIRQSIRYTKGYRTQILLFQLSFTGWFLLCVFILPVLYVVPYYLEANAVFGRYLIERGCREAEQPKSEEPAQPFQNEGEAPQE